MTEERMRALFTLADIGTQRAWKLPNGYWGDGRCTECEMAPDPARRDEYEFRAYRRQPWWLVKTAWGLIEIGWRKRVIAIDWSDTGLRAPDLTADQVTKGEFFVHAWSEATAVVYLKALGLKLKVGNVQEEVKA